jgi:hypothetical protein
VPNVAEKERVCAKEPAVLQTCTPGFSTGDIKVSFIEQADSSAASPPHAWCPRCRRPDDEASDDAIGGLADRAVSTEMSLTRSIRHQQSCQQTGNEQAAVEAR